MKKLISLITAIMLGIMLCFPLQTLALPDAGSTELGHYGSRFMMLESPIEPQYNIYLMLRDEFKKNPNADTIRLEWETTPLHYAGYYRDEAMEALSFDYPEINLREYGIETWDAELIDNYVSRLTLVLKKHTLPQASYDYQQRLSEATTVVAAASGRYQKAKAASQWLMNHCNFDAEAVQGFYGDFSWVKSNSYAFEADGVFSYGKAGSYGLAKAYKLLMDQADIPCVLAHSLNQMWAYIQLDDNNWYVIDFQNLFAFGNSYFLCGDYGYRMMESTPPNSHMQFVGKGSQIDVSPTAYITADDLAVIHLINPKQGTLTVLNSATMEFVEDGGNIEAGSAITIYCSPEQGYAVNYFLVNGQKYYPSDGFCEMNNIRDNTTIEAVLYEEAQVPDEVEFTIGSAEGGRLTVSDGFYDMVFPGLNTYIYGQNLTITPEAEDGYDFSYVKIERISGYDENKAPIIADTVLAGPGGTEPLEGGVYTITHAVDEYILTPYFVKSDASPLCIDAINSYGSGKSVITITNKTSSSPDATLLFAVYQEKRLIKCEKQNVSVEPGNSQDISFRWTQEAGASYTVKAYIWEDTATMQPLARPVSKTIGAI